MKKGLDLLLKSDIYKEEDTKIRKGLFCAYIGLVVIDNTNASILFEEGDFDNSLVKVIKGISEYYNLKFTDLEIRLFSCYDFSIELEKLVAIDEKLMELKDIDKLIHYLNHL